MIQEPLSAIASYTGGELRGEGAEQAEIAGVSTDTRTLKPGNLFIPLAGERFDGHTYAEAAVHAGAAAVLWQADHGEPSVTPAVVVDDTLAALQRLAARYRETLDVKVIGITGSNGKTTTKDMTAAVLATAYRVHKTAGNYNNHIGLPLTLLSLERGTEFAVIEMGMSGRGEIELLTGIAKPDAAVITNIGDAHLLQLGSRDEIAKAKLEIRSGLPDGGILIIPGDEPLIDAYLPEMPGPKQERLIRFGFGASCDIRLASVELSAEETRFHTADSSVEFRIPMLGRHNAINALAAIAVGRMFNIADESIAEGLAGFTPSGMRIERVAGKKGTTIWNDCYNANPSSMKAALSLLAEAQGFRHKFAVLGDMLELGPMEQELHRDIGRLLRPDQVDYVFSCGELGRWIAEEAKKTYEAGKARAFASKEELAETLLQLAGEGDLILVKGSRGMKLETIVDVLRLDP
jgi:UDP-N-acetylmuramoyl-tripeptide--D-alanyl-D-alanine ligase